MNYCHNAQHLCEHFFCICKAIKRRKSLLTTELRMFIKRNQVSRETHWYVVYQVINARWLHPLNVLAVFPHASCSLLFPAIFFQKGIFEGYWCSYTFHHPALSSPTTSKYQLSQMNSRDGIMLLTELDITDKLPIDRRRHCQLSWQSTVQFIVLWASTFVEQKWSCGRSICCGKIKSGV